MSIVKIQKKKKKQSSSNITTIFILLLFIYCSSNIFNNNDIVLANSLTNNRVLYIDNSGKLNTTDTTPEELVDIKNNITDIQNTLSSIIDNNNTSSNGKIDTAGSGLEKVGTTIKHLNEINAKTDLSIGAIAYDSTGHIIGFKQKTLGRGINDSADTIGHSNSVTAKTNTNIVGVSYDAQGHITGKGTEYTTTTSISSSSTDTQLPTAKGVYGFSNTYIKNLYAGSITLNSSSTSVETTISLSESVNNYDFIIVCGGHYWTDWCEIADMKHKNYPYIIGGVRIWSTYAKIYLSGTTLKATVSSTSDAYITIRSVTGIKIK